MYLIKTNISFVAKRFFVIASVLLVSAYSFASKPNKTPQDSVVVLTIPEDSVLTIVEKMPQFQGGDKALLGFVNNTIVYPTEAIKKKEEGKVIVQFAVTSLGKIANVKVLRSVSPSLDAEAIRVVSLLPAWIPGEQNGKPVAVAQVIPVTFQIPTEESMWKVTGKTLVVIDDVSMPENFDLQILNPVRLTSAQVFKPFPKEEKKRLKSAYGKRAEDGVVVITTKKEGVEYLLADSLPVTLRDSLCKEPIKKPEFNGGQAQLTSYLTDSIQYPFVCKQLKKQGKVTVRFLVDKTGKISDAKVINRADYYLDKEAVRLINVMPAWTPGSKCGEKLNIYVSLPVNFKLDLPAAEKEWERNEKTIVMLNGVRLPQSFDVKNVSYTNLASYKVLQPSTKEITKKLVKEYGKDAVNGVILISTNK